MRLPRQGQHVTHSSKFLAGVVRGVAPSDTAAIPQAIALVLARDHAIEQITGSLIQCIGTITGILNDYDRCTERGGVRCENIAARQIATIACRSYCTCT